MSFYFFFFFLSKTSAEQIQCTISIRSLQDTFFQLSHTQQLPTVDGKKSLLHYQQFPVNFKGRILPISLILLLKDSEYCCQQTISIKPNILTSKFIQDQKMFSYKLGICKKILKNSLMSSHHTFCQMAEHFVCLFCLFLLFFFEG